MGELSIFISHGTKYADIATSFKRSLLMVRSSKQLSLKLSEDMPAGREWRRWIDDNVRTADVFVLLYPHTAMDMGWCNYELGRFYKSDDNVVCIRNTDIPTPPPVFEPYQSIVADQAGLIKFMKDSVCHRNADERRGSEPKCRQGFQRRRNACEHHCQRAG